MVTATTMSVRFRDLKTNEHKSVSGYISDVIGTKMKWNQAGIASATTDDTIQFENPVVIEDVSILTGPTVSVGFNWYARNTIIASSATLISPNLTTNASRSFPSIAFGAGTLISAREF